MGNLARLPGAAVVTVKTNVFIFLSLRGADLSAATADPLCGELLLHAVLPQARLEASEVDLVQGLVLIEAGEHVRHFAGRRIAVWLQALRADLLHHALHRRVDRSDAALRRLHERPESIAPGAGNRRHHAVRADGDEPIAAGKLDGLWPKRAARIGDHGLHDVAHVAPVLRPPGDKTRRFFAAPYDDVGRSLDLGDLLEIDRLPIVGKVQNARARVAERPT